MIKSYSDVTLMRLTKAELIEHLRCAEHNRDAIEQRLEQYIENVKDWQPVVHGHWFFTDYDFFCCSCCGESFYNGAETTKEAQELLENGNVYNYCPNCGAKMGEVEE